MLQEGKTVGRVFARACLGLVLSVAFLGLNAQKGRIKFEKVYHNFAGVHEENGAISFPFVFANTGPDSLRITKVKLSCGCTQARFPKTPIAPGEQGVVEVVYDPANRPGSFRKPAHVYTDGQPSTVVLTLAGQVIPRPKGPRDFYPFLDGNIRFKTNHLTYGFVKTTEQPQISTVLYNDGHTPIHFFPEKAEIPVHISLQWSKTSLQPGDTLTLTGTYNAGAKNDWGFVFDEIYLPSDDSLRPMKRLNVSAHIKEHFDKAHRAQPPRAELSPGSLDLGELTHGEIKTFPLEIENKGQGDLLIRKVFSSCSCLEFEYPSSPIAPGTTAILQVSFNSRGRIGEVEKDFVLITNSPAQPEMTVNVTGKILPE